MHLVHENDYRLRLMDFDRYGRIRPQTVLDLLQDVADAQSTLQGIGHDDMAAQGVFWVVTRMSYELVGEPGPDHVLIARTWPHDVGRYSCQRDYDLRNAASGQTVAVATSEWVLVDAVERKLAPTAGHLDPDLPYLQERAMGKPRKIRSFEPDGGPALTLVPLGSDIDLNGHVNNACYARFAADALDLGAEERIAALQIDYRHEVMAHEPLILETRRERETALVRGVREDGNTAFAAKATVRA